MALPNFWPFNVDALLCIAKFRTMYANVLNFHILIPHEKLGDLYFFLFPIISYFRVISLLIK